MINIFFPSFVPETFFFKIIDDPGHFHDCSYTFLILNVNEWLRGDQRKRSRSSGAR